MLEKLELFQQIEFHNEIQKNNVIHIRKISKMNNY